MSKENVHASESPSYNSRGFLRSRRQLLVNGAIAGVGVAGAIGLEALISRPGLAASPIAQYDAKILNKALFYEHQAIWAYGAAAGKLTSTSIGQAVLALALRNQADHKQHRDTLITVIQQLGGVPTMAQSSYDVSSYIKRGEGNLDSDVNIAKLALALETDAAIAYTQEAGKLRTPALITAGASIATAESAHAAAIRATFKSLGVNIEIVPTAFVSAENRASWILPV